MPIKEKIEVEMLSPLMAEFIPDYSDIVDLDDAEPLEGPDLVQYQPSIAEKVDEINRLGIVWNYVGELVFNLLVLVGAVKASDRIVKEIMGL